MSESLPHLPWMEWEETRHLLAAFRASGTECRFVGGCVRDALLARSIADVDIATPATPDAVMALLESHQIKAIPTGVKHGTVTAVLGGKHFEITTLRKDVSTDGRHAEVAFTDDWKEDAQRRDFTLNALYADQNGTLYDYFGGVKDARSGIVRFIGDPEARIREDVLRILRFYRFSARFAKGAFDAAGDAACGRLRDEITHLSGERIHTEMLKLLPQARAFDALTAMKKNEVLHALFHAEVTLSHFQTAKHLSPHYAHTQDPLFLLGVLIAATPNPSDTLAFIASRWKLSNAERKRLAAFTEPLTNTLPTEKDAKHLIRTRGARFFADRCLLSAVIYPEQMGELASYMALVSDWQPPIFPITGDDLLKHGVPEGAALGECLRTLETLWEESDYRLSKAELLARLK